jgi:NAD(P)H-quinone oxidoreductase subunit 4L
MTNPLIEIGLHHYLLLGALLFVCGVVCMATKRNAIGVLMGVELVLNGATVNFVAFAHTTVDVDTAEELKG